MPAPFQQLQDVIGNSKMAFKLFTRKLIIKNLNFSRLLAIQWRNKLTRVSKKNLTNYVIYCQLSII